MRNELIFLFVVTLAVAGCANEDHTHDSSADARACLPGVKGNNNTVSYVLDNGATIDCRINTATQNGTINNTADPIAAIPIENGVDANNIQTGPQVCPIDDPNLSYGSCIEAGGLPNPAAPE
jgi:hypothetical protein